MKLIQPLPWHVNQHYSGLFGVWDSNDIIVLSHVTQDEAEFIVRAVNSHDDLVRTLAAAYCDTCEYAYGSEPPHRDDCPDCREAHVVLAKAQGLTHA